MGGNQFGFIFTSSSDINTLYMTVYKRLNDYLDFYKLTQDDIVYVMLSFRQKDKKLLSEFSLSEKAHIPKSDFIITDKKLNVPVSINEDSIGKPLSVNVSNGVITNINIIINNKQVNFLDIIRKKAKVLRPNHKDNITHFDENFRFYLLKDNSDYVLAIKKLSVNLIDKIRYSLSGVVISHVTDNAVDNLILRSWGERLITIDNGKIVNTRQNIKLKALELPSYEPLFVENSNIGVIDIETYRTIDNTFKVYALGFKTNLDIKSKIYYVDEISLDSDIIVLSLVDELLRSKYENITFYCHNLGGYDIVFILSILYNYNDTISYVRNEKEPVNNHKYKIYCTLREDKIIKVKISKGAYSLIILDSYAMLPNKLSKLGEDFEVAILKSKFPYKFATTDHLFYEGVMPSIDNYEDITKEEYDSMFVGYWSFYDETIKYLNNDLYSLHEVLTRANKQVFLDYNINMTESITISGLAIRIFLQDFYDSNIPNIDKPSVYRDIKEGYYGGITEVYKPSGNNLFYYDVNSLYPYVALQDMPGLICSKLNYYDDNQDICSLFAFYYCSIDAPLNSYLGLLPLRTLTGLIFPLGKWEGWYFSEELKFAKEQGYNIKVLKGYSFSRESNVFSKYINKVYKIKADPVNATQKSMAKSLLNNLLGRFGINFEKPITEVLSEETFQKKMLMYKIVSYKQITENRVLVSYIPSLDYDIITSHGLDYLKIVSKFKDNELRPLTTTSIVISAAITAYARIHMNKLKLDILKSGAKIYYSDTDSIITNRELPNSLVSSIAPLEIGKLKLELVLLEAYFVSNKLYFMCDIKGKTYVRPYSPNLDLSFIFALLFPLFPSSHKVLIFSLYSWFLACQIY